MNSLNRLYNSTNECHRILVPSLAGVRRILFQGSAAGLNLDGSITRFEPGSSDAPKVLDGHSNMHSNFGVWVVFQVGTFAPPFSYQLGFKHHVRKIAAYINVRSTSNDSIDVL